MLIIEKVGLAYFDTDRIHELELGLAALLPHGHALLHIRPIVRRTSKSS